MASSQSHLSRKMAAILHADVVGSTTLVQKNEVTAHERMQDAFRHLSRTIADYGGTSHEIRGDALVAEFGRASDAVCAALAFQARRADLNDEIRDDIRPELRIGVSLGEVIVADQTITGPGVVLAQRLEQLAQPGGVVVQGTVSETVPGRLPFTFESLGEQVVKGFDQPVRAFVARTKAGESVPEPLPDTNADVGGQIGSAERGRPESPGKPSVAVLPFSNMSGDPEQEYFSDGITEDIITELSRFRELIVIARNSSFVFKNKSVDVTDVGRQLGVLYAVEGSVRKSGDRVRITAQLIDTVTGAHLWADRYDRDLEDIFDVQDEVARIIASTLAGRVGLAHKERARQKPPSSLDAYDWFVQGRELFYHGTSEGNTNAAEMFERAISVDPDYAAAYALLAESHVRDWITFWNYELETSFERAWKYAKTAVILDDTDSRTHTALGVANLYSGNHDESRFCLERAVELNPSDTHALIYLSRLDVFTGDPERAIERVGESKRCNPFGKYNWSLVPAYFAARRYDDAIHVMRSIQNPAPIMLCWFAATYAHSGDNESAKTEGGRFLAQAEGKLGSPEGTPVSPGWVEFIARRYPAKLHEDREHFVEGLRKAGIPG